MLLLHAGFLNMCVGNIHDQSSMSEFLALLASQLQAAKLPKCTIRQAAAARRAVGRGGGCGGTLFGPRPAVLPSIQCLLPCRCRTLVLVHTCTARVACSSNITYYCFGKLIHCAIYGLFMSSQLVHLFILLKKCKIRQIN